MELSKDLLLKFYKDMVRIRKADERMLECLFAGKILTFYHSGQGQEAPGVGLCAALREDDYLYYSHRSHGINKLLPLGMSPNYSLRSTWERPRAARAVLPDGTLPIWSEAFLVKWE